MKIYADPIEPDTVYALNVNAYRSTDAGVTWVNLCPTAQSCGAGAAPPHSDSSRPLDQPANNRTMVEGTMAAGPCRSTAAVVGAATPAHRGDHGLKWTRGGCSPLRRAAGQRHDRAAGHRHRRDHGVGGGESSHIAVDPRNANVIAGNYGGSLREPDRLSGISKACARLRGGGDQPAGVRRKCGSVEPPIRLSPHNPDVVYTTSQFVHRSRDNGQTWERISPDLSKNDKGQQGPSGGKGVTRDNTGPGCTATSSRSRVTGDARTAVGGGRRPGAAVARRRTDVEITPRDMPVDRTVNGIDLSPSAGPRIVSVLSRYMLGDFTRMRLQDDRLRRHVEACSRRHHGIPAGHFVRVVREDPDRPGLLFAGTKCVCVIDDAARAGSVSG